MKNMDNTQYKTDSQGRLVPIDTIKDIDLARDDLVLEIVEKAKALNKALSTFKSTAFEDIQAFIDLSAEKYGAKIGGRKGNVTLNSYDGKYRVLRASQDNIVFDERIQAAKALIDECLRDWTDGARQEIRAIIDRAFEVDKQGNLNTGRILTLRRVEIKDPRWLKAMQAISDSTQVISSKSYIRVYERKGDTDEYIQLPLDIAGVDYD
ncbi:sulfate transporter [Oligella urethralis DNF00040]|uniref:Sulfate transporter n=2 Tax=Oligella urethralis TaxID=90245 RepID=A0A095Z6X0_9BURK|nr:sulfate transporter [Oligella urethralis DNF00040]